MVIIFFFLPFTSRLGAARCWQSSSSWGCLDPDCHGKEITSGYLGEQSRAKLCNGATGAKIGVNAMAGCMEPGAFPP